MHVKKGEIYGFLGPNGAGKTTVMKMLTNLWKPTAGSIELFGEKLTPTSYEMLKRMGSIIEFPTFYDHLSGKENLALHQEYMGYYNPGSIENTLEMLHLTDAGPKPVRDFSLGMKQRLGIARAILSKPELLILDEPTNGLDPAGMKQIRDLMKMLCTEYGITIIVSSHILSDSKPELLILDEPTNGLDPAGMKQIRDLMKMLCTEYGITIIVSSHILSEVESIADTIGVINRGVLMKEIAMKEISEMSLAYIELNVINTQKASYVLADKMEIDNFKIVEDGKLRIYDRHISTQELLKVLSRNNVEIVSIGKKSESLEDYFLKMTEEV